MPLNSSGPISLGGSTLGQSIALQLDLVPTSIISLNDTAVRTLAGVVSGEITMPDDFWGKPGGFSFSQTITTNTNNYDLKNAAIAAGWDQVTALIANVTINPGVFVQSTSTGLPAFSTGTSFPLGSNITITNNGYIVGRGGTGATGPGSGGGGGADSGPGGGAGPSGIGNAGSAGSNTLGGAGGALNSIGNPMGDGQAAPGVAGGGGGTALQVQTPITLINNGVVGSGGGGGGSGGYLRIPSASITAFAGGSGGNLGQPGNAGQGGGAAPGGAGGATGNSITGYGLVTLSGTGSVLGPTVSGVFSFSQTITSNTSNYNLINSATAAGWNGVLPLIANVTINPGVTVNSTSASIAAFLIGSLPYASSVTVTNNGEIRGKGGNGGSAGPVPGTVGSAGGGGAGTTVGLAGTFGSLVGLAGTAGTTTTGGTGGTGMVGTQPTFGPQAGINIDGTPGENGGTGLSVSYTTALINNGPIIGGGGGGGGSSGTVRYIEPGGAPTLRAQAGIGGNGGNLGQPGTAGQTLVAGADGGAGGTAGPSINGYSLVTLSGSGSLIGPTI
jgi:hypothetical protein